MTLKPGDYVINPQPHSFSAQLPKLLVVESIDGHLVRFEGGYTGGAAWAEEHRSPIQKGTRIHALEGGKSTVSHIEVPESGLPLRVWHRHDDNDPIVWGDFDKILKRVVTDEETPAVTKKNPTEPFATGSIVKFRQDLEYRVVGYDGEHHNLEAVDPDPGDDLSGLYFGPEFFELVKGPPIPDGTAVQASDGTNYLVSRAGDTVVYLTRADGSGFSVRRALFDASYTLLA